MFPSTSKRLDAPVKETKDKDVLSKMGESNSLLKSSEEQYAQQKLMQIQVLLAP